MGEIKNEFQSKYGFFSILLGILSFGYIAFLRFDVVYNNGETLKSLFNLMPDGGGRGETGTGLLLTPLLLFLPIIGFLAGIIFGLIGVFQNKDRKTFAIIGLIMNSLIPVSLTVIYFLIITCVFCPKN